MDVSHADFMLPSRTAGASARRDLAEKWATVAAAASIVATLAGVPAQLGGSKGSDSLPLSPAAEDLRLGLASQAIDDVAVIMEAGVAALLDVVASGGDPAAAARALWHEYARARESILKLL